MTKHFRYTITDEAFTFERNEDSIAEEAALDGIYVLRTSVAAESMDSEDVVRAYKRLSTVERACRISKDFAIEIEPIRHRREDRVRAHIFLCMLALYVRIHMERALAPLLFTDHEPERAEARKASVVAPAVRSPAALTKVTLKKSDDGLPVHSFRSRLRDLATLTRNTVRMDETDVTFERTSTPTALQAKALELLGLSAQL